MNQSNASIRLSLGCLIDMLNTSDSTYRLAPCLTRLSPLRHYELKSPASIIMLHNGIVLQCTIGQQIHVPPPLRKWCIHASFSVAGVSHEIKTIPELRVSYTTLQTSIT